MPSAPANDVTVAEVAVALPVLKPYTYLVPAGLEAAVEPGLRVKVDVGPREVTGFVVSRRVAAFDPGLKPIRAVLEKRPSLTPVTLALGLWVAEHYGAGPGEALQAVVPAAVRHGRRGRHERVVSLLDPARARALLAEHANAPAWAGRRRVLRALLERSDVEPSTPERLSDLEAEADVTSSPIETLAKLGVLSIASAPIAPDPFATLRPSRAEDRPLTGDQAKALAALLPRLERLEPHAALLHGVTGSGKTEVYLRLIARTLELGRSAILLVPEIALTPQTVERILGRVPEVAVLHSNLSDGDRARHWERLRSGAVRVAVGPRSAIFAPLQDVGLIILDEEHETTFKQQTTPRYHARDAALVRGRMEGALVVLGSATPSLETEGLCRAGRMERHRLPTRVLGRPLPEIGIIDLRHQKPVGIGGLFSSPLVAAIDRTLAKGEQAILFLNRRGFSTNVLCRVCGWKATCARCAVNLVHYRSSERLLCHYCGHESAPPTSCPECLSPGVRYGGFGTEKVVEAAKALFPGRRVVRMDSETLRRRGSAERLFNELRDGKIDLLIGTQVLAKGFDIPGISLVGVVSADTALLIPDFRSAERTFQLLCQVAGRTGRGDRPGRVLIQTWCPDHYAIRAAARHDDEGFADEELRHRKALAYPPYGHLLRLVLQGEDEAATAEESRRVAELCAALPAVRGREVTMLGPAPCPIPLLKGAYRHHLLFASPDAERLTSFLADVPRRALRKVRILLDRDPVALL